MKFDIGFERDVLAAALKNEEFMKRSWRIVDAHHLATEELQWVWTILKKSWSRFNERPDSKYFIFESKKIKDEDKRRACLKELRRLYIRKPKSAGMELEELANFVRQTEYHMAAIKLIDAVSEGKLEEAEKVFHAAAKIQVRPRNYTLVKWFEEFDRRQEDRRYERTHKGDLRIVPTGFKRLDRILGGGHRAGELGIIMGTTGRGKSIFLVNLCLHAVKVGYKVAYLAFEMPARQVATRSDSNWLGLEYRKFKEYDFEESELRRIRSSIRARQKKFVGKFRILSWPVRSANLQVINSALEDLRIEENFRPDLLVFDSLDHLKAIEERGNDFRLQQKEVYETAKAFAEAEQYSVWSSTQAGSQYASKIATSEAASESYDKARISDTVITINDPNVIGRRRKSIEVKEGEDEEDEEAEIEGYKTSTAQPKSLRAMLAKYRDGESNVIIDLEFDAAKMKMREKKRNGNRQGETEEAEGTVKRRTTKGEDKSSG